MSNHTPGPWEADSTHCRTAINSVATANSQRKHIAMVNLTKNPEYEITIKEHEANAKLIAAAPEMLVALMAVDNYFTAPGEDDWAHQKSVTRFCREALEPVRRAIKLAMEG